MAACSFSTSAALAASLASQREFDEHRQILDLPFEREQRRDFPAQRGDFLDVLLRAFLVRPEIGLGHLAFEFR